MSIQPKAILDFAIGRVMFIETTTCCIALIMKAISNNSKNQLNVAVFFIFNKSCGKLLERFLKWYGKYG